LSKNNFSRMQYSVSEENYIKAIYHLQKTMVNVNTNAVAEQMLTKPASVTDMLKKLKAKKLLQYEKYKGFKLNEAGKKIALHIIRKHRLWEYFLVNKLGFDWDKVHNIAEELEHISSDELINKLAAFLNHPSFDPHGDPIPDINGKIPVIKQIQLIHFPLKKSATVSSVTNQSAEMLDMLKHYNIGIGTTLKVVQQFLFDGSLQIKINKSAACIISAQAAKNIFVHHES
jgi:DtxR family transcriptional regulator, Mn-dependent transcriptional regulator